MTLSGKSDTPLHRTQSAEVPDKDARVLHHLAVNEGRAEDDWDFGPAEYMRSIFTEQARAAVEAAFDSVDRRVYGELR